AMRRLLISWRLTAFAGENVKWVANSVSRVVLNGDARKSLPVPTSRKRGSRPGMASGKMIAEPVSNEFAGKLFAAVTVLVAMILTAIVVGEPAERISPVRPISGRRSLSQFLRTLRCAKSRYEGYILWFGAPTRRWTDCAADRPANAEAAASEGGNGSTGCDCSAPSHPRTPPTPPPASRF